MKKQIIVLISLAFFLVTLNGVHSAMYSMCGDGYCDTAYDEGNPTSFYFCPGDCGGRINESWCDTTYPRDCPPCSPTSTCRAEDIPTFELSNWCGSNGYTKNISTCPFPWVENIAFIKITGNKCKDGLIILGFGIFLISGIIGFLIKKKRHKRKKK